MKPGPTSLSRASTPVDLAVERVPHEHDVVVLIDQIGIAPQHMALAGIADQPAALDLRSHRAPPRVCEHAVSLSGCLRAVAFSCPVGRKSPERTGPSSP